MLKNIFELGGRIHPLQTHLVRTALGHRDIDGGGVQRVHLRLERESLAAPGAIAGTAAVRCDVAAPVTTDAKLLRNGLENVTITWRQL
jgi:hypothetical protein